MSVDFTEFTKRMEKSLDHLAEEFGAVREALEAAGVTFAHAEVEMVPQNYITLTSEDDMAKMRKLLDNLEDNDDVQNVWHNWENEDEYEG